MEIRILGAGCPKCIKLFNNTQKAVEEIGLDANIAKISNIMEISSYGVMSTPALVIDGKVVLAGKTADVKKIKELLTK